MQIIRGDAYQSWVYKIDNTLVAVDPWLNRKQEFPLLSWLLYRKVKEDSYLIKNNLIHSVTHVIITAHFSDHLDLNSLNLFNKNILIYTTKEAARILNKNGFTNITVVERNKKYHLDDFILEPKIAGKPYNSTSFAYVISHNSSRIFHESHVVNSNHDLKNIDVSILTIDNVKVLGFIEVSMGMKTAVSRMNEMGASYILPTGISPKSTKGLITWILLIKENDQALSGAFIVCHKTADSLIV